MEGNIFIMVNIKEFKIIVDTREPIDTFEKVQKICPLSKREELSVGDIAYNNIIIELKSFSDFIQSIIDNRFRNQLYNISINDDIIPYYIIYGKWTDINKYSQIKMTAVIGAMVSICTRYGVSLNVLPNKDYAIYYAIKIIEKTVDHKEVKPVTYKPTTEDHAVNMLIASADRILEKGVRNALEYFGTVKKVINSDPKELESIKYIGKETVARFYETINHDFSKKEDVGLIDIDNDKIEEDIEAEIDYDRMKIVVFTLIESYSNKHNKACPLENLEKLLPNLTGMLLRQMLNDLILESRIYEADNKMFEVY